MSNRKSKYPDEVLSRMRALGKAGKTVKEIANEVGVPYKYAQSVFFDRKWEFARIRTKKPRSERNELVKARIAIDLTREEVEWQAKISIPTLEKLERDGFGDAVKRAVRLARIYKTTVEKLVGDPDV